MYLLLILTSIGFHRFCSSTYEYVCPTALNWQIRSIALCTNTEKYSCLRDENKDNYREICRKTPSMLAPGNKYVIKGNLDGEDCNGHRYQPFIFQTSKNSECAIKKSSCNEAGQIMFSNGSTTEDKSCRCDYSKRYAPIQKHSNPCYCVPSKEDCSCYLKLCPAKTHLSSEYTCVSDYTLVTRDYCGQIALSGYEDSNRIFVIGNAEEKEDKVILVSYKFDEIFLVARITGITVLAVLAGVLSAAFLVIISGLFSNDDNQLNVKKQTNKPTHDDEGEIIVNENLPGRKKETSPDKGKVNEELDERKKETSPDKGKVNVHLPERKKETSPDKGKVNEELDERKKETSPDKGKVNENLPERKKETSPDKGKVNEELDERKKETSPDKGKVNEELDERSTETLPDKGKGNADVEGESSCASDNDTSLAGGNADVEGESSCTSDNDTSLAGDSAGTFFTPKKETAVGNADVKGESSCASDNNTSLAGVSLETFSSPVMKLAYGAVNISASVANGIKWLFSPSSKTTDKDDDRDDQSNASAHV